MTPTQQTALCEFILSQEARTDSKGNLTVYTLPPGDGGGLFEVAGINDRFDHDLAYQLRAFIQQGQQEQAKALALSYYWTDTQDVAAWSSVPAVEAFLRDCVFNRGEGGTVRIIQIALQCQGIKEDGVFGPITGQAVAVMEGQPEVFLMLLRLARELYEHQVAPPVGVRAKFWAGLENRWDACYAFAKGLL